MVTADSVKAKIQGLIATANAKTGKSDTELTSAVNHLAEGYGSSSGGGSGIIDVTELPTENIDENAVYRVKGYSEIDCLACQDYMARSFEDWAKYNGFNVVATYSVVETLPENAQTTDLVTFSHCYIYICNDIPYIYGNMGAGNMFIPLTTLLSSVIGATILDGGYVESAEEITDYSKLYVTYSKDSIGVPDMSNNTKVFRYRDSEWELLAKDDSNFLKYTLSDDGTHYIVSAENTDRYPAFIKVLPYYNGLPVSEIAEEGFANCYGLNEITFYSDVKLAEGAFRNCTSLTQVKSANANGEWVCNFEEIPPYAFYGCSSLKDSGMFVRFSAVKNIGQSAFEGCSSLKAIFRPDGLEHIGDRAFYGCYSAEASSTGAYIYDGRIHLPSTVKTVGGFAYYGTRAQSVRFLGTPESISSSAFSECLLLRSISVPWAEGEVEGEDEKWGAPSTATIYYNSTET